MKDLFIRHSEKRDVEAIRAIYAEPENYAGTLQLPLPSYELWESRLATFVDLRKSLVACRGDEVLGQLGLEVSQNVRRRHCATVGMAVRGSAKRQGVGTALMTAAIETAEQWMAVTRLELEVYVDNAPAIALYEKFAFVAEGVRRKFAFRNGQYVDVLSMARVR